MKNNKYLHLLVFKSEAQWAYAMQMKQVISNSVSSQPKQSDGASLASRNPNRLKVHAKKRLHKAYEAA